MLKIDGNTTWHPESGWSSFSLFFIFLVDTVLRLIEAYGDGVIDVKNVRSWVRRLKDG